MSERSRALRTAPGNELLLFLADLGAALSAIGETVDAIELRLALIARAYGLEDARFSVFPTSLFLTLGRGEAATIEPTKRLSATPRLDQIAAVHRLADEAERGMIAPGAGIARLEEIRATSSRYGPLASVLGYTTLTMGIALILRPAPRDVAAAAVLGTIVGVLARRRWCPAPQRPRRRAERDAGSGRSRSSGSCSRARSPAARSGCRSPGSPRAGQCRPQARPHRAPPPLRAGGPRRSGRGAASPTTASSARSSPPRRGRASGRARWERR